MIKGNRFNLCFTLNAILKTLIFCLLVGCPYDPKLESEDHPDLSIESYTLTPAEPNVSEPLTFTAVLKNIGNAESGSFRLEFQNSTEESPHRVDVPNLIADETFTAERVLRLTHPMNYRSILWVDSDEEVGESDESNNRDTLFYAVEERPLPDLTIVSYTIIPANPDTKDSITFTAVLKNQGGALSVPCQLEFPIGGEELPPRFNIPHLIPDETFTVERVLQLTHPMNYRSILWVDSDEEVGESEEKNNRDTLFFSVSEDPMPDLTITSYTIIPEIPNAEDTITFRAIIKNIGYAESDSSRLEFKIGEEEAPPHVNIPILEPEETFTVERVLQLSNPADYYSFLSIDSEEKVAESDEHNNKDTLFFTVVKAFKPDLAISAFYFQPESPTVSDTITFAASVINLGRGQSKPCGFSITVDDGALVLKYDMPALDSGDVHIFTRRVFWDKPGIFTVTAFADYNAVNSENDKGNNRDTLTVQIVSVRDVQAP